MFSSDFVFSEQCLGRNVNKTEARKVDQQEYLDEDDDDDDDGDDDDP